MRLGDVLSPDDKLKYVRSSLVPGRILHIHCNFTDPPKNKFVVVVSIKPVLVLFVINSVISQWLDARADLRDRQVTIRQQDHAYLKRDSFLNCTEAIRQMEIENVERQLIIADASNAKDMITASEREAILYAVKDCRTLSKREIQWITEALSV
nr:hypothetical protein [Nitrosomonas nitrosa]